ncbi:unnamed protein product [Paramecium primaurelia]|uniref:Uncharacterized protein n=1 Tax=Paramecium primaurelia TaxID=5886 RepID=A0A8S1Q2Q8_PARPR|nr:unnamed protein product [Paramecium primaurelia]
MKQIPFKQAVQILSSSFNHQFRYIIHGVFLLRGSVIPLPIVFDGENQVEFMLQDIIIQPQSNADEDISCRCHGLCAT